MKNRHQAIHSLALCSACNPPHGLAPIIPPAFETVPLLLSFVRRGKSIVIIFVIWFILSFQSKLYFYSLILLQSIW